MQRCAVQLTELQAHEPAARPQNAIRFAQHAIDVRTIADSKRNRIRRERIVLERQLLRIRASPCNINRGRYRRYPAGRRRRIRLTEAQILGALASHVQHVLVDVGDRHVAARLFRRLLLLLLRNVPRVDVVDVTESDVTRSAGHVQQPSARRRSQALNERVLPDAMNAR